MPPFPLRRTRDVAPLPLVCLRVIHRRHRKSIVYARETTNWPRMRQKLRKLEKIADRRSGACLIGLAYLSRLGNVPIRSPRPPLQRLPSQLVSPPLDNAGNGDGDGDSAARTATSTGRATAFG
ncbi:hypothetical protein C8Q79DRAFT_497420 [Trametes meyenii]|nr:hypothetical protein C8Q79DRAFT_497420 [Trametes meyenii]